MGFEALALFSADTSLFTCEQAQILSTPQLSAIQMHKRGANEDVMGLGQA
jgi:hypothetical protein